MRWQNKDESRWIYSAFYTQNGPSWPRLLWPVVAFIPWHKIALHDAWVTSIEIAFWYWTLHIAYGTHHRKEK